MESVESRLSKVEKGLSDMEARFDERSKTLFNRVNDLTAITAALSELTASNREMAIRVSAVERTSNTLQQEVEVLKGAPGRKWNTAATTVITSIISIVIGYLLARLVG